MNNIHKIQSPYMELNFYYPERPEYLSFAHVIKALDSLDAEFLCEGVIHKGEGIRDKPFATTSNYDRELVQFEIDDLDSLISDPDILLSEVFFRNAVGSKPDTKEAVVYVRVFSPQAVQNDRHPIAVYADGTMFHFTDEESLALEERAGTLAYKRFLQIIKSTKPAYAAITFEEPLMCPTDLEQNPLDRANRAFNNFYVSKGFINQVNLDEIRALYDGAYQEYVNDGVYISTSEMLNPGGINLESDKLQLKRDKQVGGIIGSLATKLK